MSRTNYTKYICDKCGATVTTYEDAEAPLYFRTPRPKGWELKIGVGDLCGDCVKAWEQCWQEFNPQNHAVKKKWWEFWK